MLSDRRTVLRGLGAAAISTAFPGAAMAQRSGTRVFDLYRGKSRIGGKTLTVARGGDVLDVEISIDIKVRILGLPAYSYRLESRERWAGGVLQRLEAETDDDGTADSVSASRTGDGLSVRGTGFEGLVRGNPGTTTYWTQAFLKRPVWISTQTGKPLNVTARRGGTTSFPTAAGAVPATRWNIGGDIGELELFYDASGEWIGNAFEARGQQARFVLRDRGPNLADLWTGA